MLIRLDPHQEATSVLSLPRDLKVEIPGHGIDKLNQAYSIGGPTLTLQTIKQLTGLKINHVVNVQFRGFRDAVNALGCVYVDVDRRYFHSNDGLPIGQRYAEIDIQPGYQKLCGTDALNYVRYRHTDSDIVRAARQQGFLRAVKDQVSTSALFGQRTKLIDIFAASTQTDASLDTTKGLLRILKLALFSAGHPVREVQFPAEFDVETLPGGAEIAYVVASPDAVQRTVQRFLRPSRAQTRPRVQLTPNENAPRTAPAPHRPAERSGRRPAAPAATARRRERTPPAHGLPDLLPLAADPVEPLPDDERRPRLHRPRPRRRRTSGLPPGAGGQRGRGPVLGRAGHRLAHAADPRRPSTKRWCAIAAA